MPRVPPRHRPRLQNDAVRPVPTGSRAAAPVAVKAKVSSAAPRSSRSARGAATRRYCSSSSATPPRARSAIPCGSRASATGSCKGLRSRTRPSGSFPRRYFARRK
eukprot:7308060-Prymnesium_polylepis.1